MRFNHATRKFGLDHRVIKTPPCVEIVDGKYLLGKRSPIRSVLVDYESARNAGIADHGSVDAMDKYVLDLTAQKYQEFIEARIKVKSDREAELRLTRKHCHWRNRLAAWEFTDRKSGDPFLFMAVV
ncbi:hypothetical protein RRF57_008850 [Xylaria bambusicola]|uniref:Uncharacterized protein n=1 Tax=Xylaria bambusicola TaxID=326684 RepID=A0AAN7UUL8_9PEZI